MHSAARNPQHKASVQLNPGYGFIGKKLDMCMYRNVGSIDKHKK